MKHTITLFLWLLLIATTLEGDNPKGWYSLRFPASGHVIEDICFIDSLRGWAITDLVNDTAYILYTSNGGEDWQVQSDDSYYLYSIDFVDDNTGYVAASQPPGIVLKTINGGNNWFVVSQLAASPIWDIDFISTDTGWICSDDLFDGGIFRTTNGGASWQRQVQPLLGYRHLDFLNRDTGWCLLNGGQIIKTTNSGINWIYLAPVSFSGLEEDINFHDDLTGWVLNGQSFQQGIYKTTNGGQNWFTQYDPTFENGWPTSITILSKKKGWIAKTRNIVAMIDENTWGAQTLPLSFPSLRSIDYVDSNIVFAAGGVILKTTDGGGPITSVGSKEDQISESYSLIGNYPNPFNSRSVIRYRVKEPATVSVTVFDISGKPVSTLLKDVTTAPGEHEIVFDAQTLASGVYICALNARSRTGKEAYSGTVRMLLVK